MFIQKKINFIFLLNIVFNEVKEFFLQSYGFYEMLFQNYLKYIIYESVMKEKKEKLSFTAECILIENV